MLGKKKCLHFTIVNDRCIEFTPIMQDTTRYPYGCNPKEFENYMQNLVVFFYDRTTPPTRQFIEKELAELGMRYYEMGTLIARQSGRSFSDSYWVIVDA